MSLKFKFLNGFSKAQSKYFPKIKKKIAFKIQFKLKVRIYLRRMLLPKKKKNKILVNEKEKKMVNGE